MFNKPEAGPAVEAVVRLALEQSGCSRRTDRSARPSSSGRSAAQPAR
jgi:hypothetical protein